MDDPDLWSYLDTYALALARNGDFAHAVSTQRESIERLPKDQEHFRGEMEARLKEYQAALPAEPVRGPRRSGMGDGGSTGRAVHDGPLVIGAELLAEAEVRGGHRAKLEVEELDHFGHMSMFES